MEEIKESKSLAETSDGFSLARSTPLERNKRCGGANLNNLVDSGGDANLNHFGKVDSGGGGTTIGLTMTTTTTTKIPEFQKWRIEANSPL